MRIENGVLVAVADGEIDEDGRLTLPKEVTKIGAGAFYRCLYLRFITLPKKVKKLEPLLLERVHICKKSQSWGM